MLEYETYDAQEMRLTAIQPVMEQATWYGQPQEKQTTQVRAETLDGHEMAGTSYRYVMKQ